MLLSVISFGQKGTELIGIWLTQDGGSKVEIVKNEDGSYSGKIVWLRTPRERDGSYKLDINNPDQNLRNRKIIGLQLLDGFKYNKRKEEWTGGTIYDPQSGSTYKCYMWFDGDVNKLCVKGYIGIALIGRTSNWTRIAGAA